MCDRCDRLEEQVAALKRELGEAWETRDLGLLMTKLGLSRSEARLTLFLYLRRGVAEYWKIADICAADPKAEYADGDKRVAVYVSRIRKKVGQDTIVNVWSLGYGLTDEGRAKVAAALGEP